MSRALAIAAIAGLSAPACGGAQSGAGDPCRGGEVSDPAQLAGLERCAVIGGDLVIRGAGLVELDALAGVGEIRGDLTIGPTTQLVSTRGLGGLRRVAGSLTVSHNFELGGVWLERLTAVGGAVRIERNLSLVTASLHRLVEVGGDLSIAGNGAIDRIDLSALSRVGGALSIRATGTPLVAVPDVVSVRGERHIEIVQPRKTP